MATETEKDSRFWILTVTNPDISEAVGQPVCGLVDEQAGGVIAYLLGPESGAQRLADALNALDELEQKLPLTS